MKNTLTTDHSDTLYSKLILDYYSKQGLGAGGELLRRDWESEMFPQRKGDEDLRP